LRKGKLFTLNILDFDTSKIIFTRENVCSVKSALLPLQNRQFAEVVEKSFNANMPTRSDLIKLFDRSFNVIFDIKK